MFSKQLHHHTTIKEWQVEACIKFIMDTIKNALILNRDIHLALFQIYLMPIEAGLPSPITMLFNRLIRGLLPQMNRNPININSDDLHHEAIKAF